MYKELDNLPVITIGIPVGPNVADALLNLLNNQVGELRIHLDDLRKEGATLTISTHTKPYPSWVENEDEGLKKYLEYEYDGWGDDPDIDFDIDPFD